jgi:uroporphyrinogen decarboxylase
MKEMTSRERVERTINLKVPDRVPIDIGSTASGFTNHTFFKLKAHYNVTSPDILMRNDESASYYNDDLLEKIGAGFRHVFLLPPENFELEHIDDTTFVNEWGIQKKLIAVLAQNYNCPLKEASIDDLDKYSWPDPYDKGRVTGMKQRAKSLYNDTTYALAARSVSHGIFELAWELRSMDNFFVDMMIDKKFANKLLDKSLEIQIGLYDSLLSEVGEYVQIVETADDYGTQSGVIMSPQLFREMIAPRRKELNAFIKKKAPNVKIFHHTCGSVFQIMDDLIDCGIEILNPLQPLAADMDSYSIKAKFGDRLCFHGAVDEQSALIGTKQQLEQEIKTRIEAFAPGGGYIMAPTSNFQDDMPMENITCFVELAKKYGEY